MSKKIEWKLFLEEESAMLDISVPYSNESDEEKKLTFKYELTYKEEIIAAFEKEVLALPNHSSVAHIPLSILRPERWIPEKPAVYKFTVKIVCDGTCMETIKKQITFKQYKTQNGIFLLNGKALYIKAMKIHPFVEKTGSSFTSNMYYRAAINAKRAGFNAVVVEEPSDFFVETCERFGLLVLKPEELPKSAIIYDDKTVGADAEIKLQVEQAINFCKAYQQALKNVICGAFVVADYALFDDFSRPSATAGVAKALLSLENYTHTCRCENKVYVFTKAEVCKAFVNAHPIGNLETTENGVFIGELPDTYVEYSVVTSMMNKDDYEVILKPIRKAEKFVFKVEASCRNLANDMNDMVPVTAYAMDANGNIDVTYNGDVHFVPYSSAIIRGKEDYTLNLGIGADKYGNVVAVDGEQKEPDDKYILPFNGGMATVLVSARNNSRFTGITAHSDLGSKTEYIDY